MFIFLRKICSKIQFISCKYFIESNLIIFCVNIGNEVKDRDRTLGISGPTILETFLKIIVNKLDHLIKFNYFKSTSFLFRINSFRTQSCQGDKRFFLNLPSVFFALLPDYFFQFLLLFDNPLRMCDFLLLV